MQYICTSCGKKVDAETRSACCECGGLFELDYEAPDWIRRSSTAAAGASSATASSWLSTAKHGAGVTMGEGMTPIIEFEPGVLFKMDYYMPTLSFKDRGAATLVSHMAAIGVKSCVQDSSGNGGNAVAAYCARAGIACDIYVPEGTSPKKITMIEAHGAKVHVIEGSRDHCAGRLPRAGLQERRLLRQPRLQPVLLRGHEGLYLRDARAAGPHSANILVPLGNGTLFLGTVKALEHLERSGAIKSFPNVIAIQGENCDPFYQAVEQGLDHPAEIEVKPTIAEGIAIGKPMRGREIMAMIKRHNIKVVTAPEDKILECRARIARRGIFCEHTTAANLAAYEHYCELYGPTPDVLMPMCGAGIKSEH